METQKTIKVGLRGSRLSIGDPHPKKVTGVKSWESKLRKKTPKVTKLVLWGSRLSIGDPKIKAIRLGLAENLNKKVTLRVNKYD